MAEQIKAGDRITFATTRGVAYTGQVVPVLYATSDRPDPKYVFVSFDDGSGCWIRRDRLTRIDAADVAQEAQA